MGPVGPKALSTGGATAVGIAILIAATSALAARSITKNQIGSISVPAGQTRTLTVPYPDALKYGNARYSGHATIALRSVASPGRPASVKKVKILNTGSVEGGSAFQVRVYNGNHAGTSAVHVQVTATTVEPLPHR
jgi:Flp pilus assembly protein CpaB